jgi:hypothetical protein
MADCLQNENERGDESYFTSVNLKCGMNDMKTLILALGEVLHGKNFSWIRDHCGVAEYVKNM